MFRVLNAYEFGSLHIGTGSRRLPSRPQQLFKYFTVTRAKRFLGWIPFHCGAMADCRRGIFNTSLSTALLSRSTQRLALVFQNLAWCHLRESAFKYRSDVSLLKWKIYCRSGLSKKVNSPTILAPSLSQTPHIVATTLLSHFAGKHPWEELITLRLSRRFALSFSMSFQSYLQTHFSIIFGWKSFVPWSFVWALFPTRVLVNFLFSVAKIKPSSNRFDYLAKLSLCSFS